MKYLSILIGILIAAQGTQCVEVDLVQMYEELAVLLKVRDAFSEYIRQLMLTIEFAMVYAKDNKQNADRVGVIRHVFISAIVDFLKRPQNRRPLENPEHEFHEIITLLEHRTRTLTNDVVDSFDPENLWRNGSLDIDEFYENLMDRQILKIPALPFSNFNIFEAVERFLGEVETIHASLPDSASITESEKSKLCSQTLQDIAKVTFGLHLQLTAMNSPDDTYSYISILLRFMYYYLESGAKNKSATENSIFAPKNLLRRRHYQISNLASQYAGKPVQNILISLRNNFEEANVEVRTCYESSPAHLEHVLNHNIFGFTHIYQSARSFLRANPRYYHPGIEQFLNYAEKDIIDKEQIKRFGRHPLVELILPGIYVELVTNSDLKDSQMNGWVDDCNRDAAEALKKLLEGYKLEFEVLGTKSGAEYTPYLDEIFGHFHSSFGVLIGSYLKRECDYTIFHFYLSLLSEFLESIVPSYIWRSNLKALALAIEIHLSKTGQAIRHPAFHVVPMDLS